jgi:selenobiotic family peptide radical SAM maturase
VNSDLIDIFPKTSQILECSLPSLVPEAIPSYLEAQESLRRHHPYLAELASLELAIHALAKKTPVISATVARITLNPSIQALESDWQGLPEFILGKAILPRPGKAIILIYKRTQDGPVQVRTASNNDLLALKIVAEQLASTAVARESGQTLGEIDAALRGAVQAGLLLTPGSKITRDASFFPPSFADGNFLQATTFTLQWHLTQACDLHCRHCYDRSRRSTMSLPQALAVLDHLYAFARSHYVDAQISFSGGNPLLYPHFFELYQEAADRGFILAILGNPVGDEILEKIIAIKKPAFYQVSLEGLREHNDYIRGNDHYDRIINFLARLRHYRIYSMVMLTLTRANASQVLPLIDTLTGKTDLFTFNRLAMVGEGAELASLSTRDLQPFLAAYLEKAKAKPFVGRKDNLFNLLLAENKQTLVGGCTGFGCGAAFNFVSLLADGEVHACRKFPSPIGNIFRSSLSEIYHSKEACRYRHGPAACRDCELRPACRGCPAVTYGFGLNPFRDRDPYCWKQDYSLC